MIMLSLRLYRSMKYENGIENPANRETRNKVTRT